MTKPKRLFVGRKTTEDRFTIINTNGEIGVKENRSGDVLVLKHSDLNAEQFVAQLVVFLNDQNQAIVDLYDGSKYWSDKATERIKELEEENEQLKKELEDALLDVKIYKNANTTFGNVYQEKEQIYRENKQLKQQNRQLSLIGEKQAKFIQSKGYDIQELIDYCRDGNND